jgi:uncharacterized HhH-GPD family protein
MSGTLYITGEPEVDGLLNSDPNALLIGMLLDQQITMETAFAGPAKLLGRLGHLDPTRIAAMDRDAFIAVCADKPAVHRFPSSMGARLHELCAAITERFGGDAAAIWADADSGDVLSERLRALPGFGEEKTQIFIALLAKTQGIQPKGWQDAAGEFADDTPRSIADVTDPESLDAVRAWKKARKARTAPPSKATTGRRSERQSR